MITGSPHSTPPVALLLPGQGSQYQRMAAGLYRYEQVFTEAVHEVFDLIGPDAGAVRSDWLSTDPIVPIDHVTRSQILLFMIDYAISRQIMSWGVTPVALLGHSAGELVAATLSGVIALPDAVTLMWDRVNRLADAPPGGMLAVVANSERVERYLGNGVVVGAVNSPTQVILAGPSAPLNRIAEQLKADGLTCRPVPATSGFHSPMLYHLAEESVPLFEKVDFTPPRTALYSGYTTTRLTSTDVADPRLWAHHPVAPVLFWPALDTLLGDGDFRLVEAGPGQCLATVARRHPAVARGRSEVHAASPTGPRGDEADRVALRGLAERLAD
jgi:[acyl-carrier-protein] S-malonyltransferase